MAVWVQAQALADRGDRDPPADDQVTWRTAACRAPSILCLPQYWVPLTWDLRPIYTATAAAAAAAALEAFAAAWGQRYPAIVKLWRAHWAEFVPFLAFPPEIRRVIYTTNLIESMNNRLRKVTRTRGQFPSE